MLAQERLASFDVERPREVEVGDGVVLEPRAPACFAPCPGPDDARREFGREQPLGLGPDAVDRFGLGLGHPCDLSPPAARAARHPVVIETSVTT